MIKVVRRTFLLIGFPSFLLERFVGRSLWLVGDEGLPRNGSVDGAETSCQLPTNPSLTKMTLY